MSNPDHKIDAQAAIQWNNPAVFLATGLWIGRIPWAPGTWGTLWGLPLAWGISFIPNIWGQAAVIVGLCAIGVPLCTAAVRCFGGRKDPGAIVFDEIMGPPITLFLVPRLMLERPLVLLSAFLLFRLFDITKPPPARQLEQLPDGLGIMADDWAAAIYAGLVLHALLWWRVLGG